MKSELEEVRDLLVVEDPFRSVLYPEEKVRSI